VNKTDRKPPVHPMIQIFRVENIVFNSGIDTPLWWARDMVGCSVFERF
jgi:hypothetical protein